MSIDHVSRALNLPDDIQANERLVALVLAEAAHQDTDECWPSIPSIAKRAGIRQTKYVKNCLHKLEERGLLRIVVQGCPDVRISPDRRPNLYRLCGPLAVAAVRKESDLTAGGSLAPEDLTAGGSLAPSGGVSRANNGGVAGTPQTGIEITGSEPELLARSPQQASLMPVPSVVDKPKRKRKAREDEDPDFVEFYEEIYPRRVGRAAAAQAWVSAVLIASPAEIKAGAVNYAIERNGKEAEYTAHPATWLNKKRWTDEPAEPHVPKSMRGVATALQRRQAQDGLRANGSGDGGLLSGLAPGGHTGDGGSVGRTLRGLGPGGSEEGGDRPDEVIEVHAVDR